MNDNQLFIIFTISINFLFILTTYIYYTYIFQINIQTACRVRPFTSKEFYDNNENVIKQTGSNSIQIQLQKQTQNQQQITKEFAFDYVYNENSDNLQIFNNQISNLVNRTVLEGYNSTLLVYGQTASGKTFTISSEQDSLIWQIAKQIFQLQNDNPINNIKVTFQMIEIYNEQVRDLLSMEEKKIFVREDNHGQTIIVNCSQIQPQNYLELHNAIQSGIKQSSYASTEMNEKSSRSHVLYKFVIESANNTSSMFVVDLAGSERLAKTQVEQKQRLREANNINLSLQVLNLCISKLSQGQNNHIPFRSSVLTRILQESLGGNSLTLIIGCVSPASCNASESISTCQFLQLAKKVVNAPTIAKSYNGKSTEQLRKRLAELEQQIKDYKQQNNDNIPEINWEDNIFQDYMDLEDIERIRQLKHQYNKQYDEEQSIQQGIQKLKELKYIINEIKLLAEKQYEDDLQTQDLQQQLTEVMQQYEIENKKNQDFKLHIQQLQKDDDLIAMTQEQINQEMKSFQTQKQELENEYNRLQKLQQQQNLIINKFIPKQEKLFYQRQLQYEDNIQYCKNIMKQVRKNSIDFPQNNKIPILNSQRQIQQQNGKIKIKRQIVDKIGDDEPSISIPL